jgi:hypothetical protein
MPPKAAPVNQQPGLESFKFYFPLGDPKKALQPAKSPLEFSEKLHEIFIAEGNSNPGGLGKMELWTVMDLCGLPRYASFAVFQCVDAGRKLNSISFEDFMRYLYHCLPSRTPSLTGQICSWWNDKNKSYKDEHAMMYDVLKTDGKDCLTADNFTAIIEGRNSLFDGVLQSNRLTKSVLQKSSSVILGWNSLPPCPFSRQDTVGFSERYLYEGDTDYQ